MKNFLKKWNMKGERTYLEVPVLIQIFLIIARVTGIIKWSWWAVMLPTIVPVAVFVFAVILIVLSTHDFRKY